VLLLISDIQSLSVPASLPPDHIADMWPLRLVLVSRYSVVVPCELWHVFPCTEA